MRGLLATLVLVAMVGPAAAIAETRVSAGGATVAFPIGAPERGTGAADTRHGDSLMSLFAETFGKDRGSPEEGKELVAALKSMEAWHVHAIEPRQGFVFVTMAFPDTLARSLWAESCEPPSQDRPDCRRVRVGGAYGREYLFRARNSLQPEDRSYVVEQIVVRKDRLYLLTYFGAEDEARPASEHPSSPEQEAFLRSLRFGHP
jgi:hypothetical protein